jgi:hypothetical protein
MAYVPLNVNVYSAAFAGAMAAIAVPDGAVITDPLTGNYANQAAIAAVFAQAVDTAWTGAPNSYDLNAIQAMSLQFFGPHNVGPLATSPMTTQANWTTTAVALVAAVKQGDTNFGTQGITPPGFGSGSNRAYGSGTATTAGQATITVIVAAKLIAKSTGIFKFNCKISWSALTAADVGTITTKVFTDAAAGTPLTLGNNGSIGFGSSGTAQPGSVAVANNGVFTANAGAGITIAGANAGFTYDTTAITEGTAAVGALLMVDLVTGNAAPAAAETPFAIGTTCLVTVSLTNSVAARATANITASLIEL